MLFHTVKKRATYQIIPQTKAASLSCPSVCTTSKENCLGNTTEWKHKFLVMLPSSLRSYFEVWSKTYFLIKWCRRTPIFSFVTWITLQNDLRSSVCKESQRKFVACPIILLFPSMRSAGFMFRCRHSLACDLCQYTVSFTYSREARSGDLTGQACGPKGIRGTRE